MTVGRSLRALLAGALMLAGRPLGATELTVEGGPTQTGFNSGTFVYIHATVHGIGNRPKRYVVFAEIQYYGTTSNASVEMDRVPPTKPGVEEFQVGWPIPAQAPTGFYTLALHVDDRIDHVPGITRKVQGFVVYQQLARISHVSLDKSIYNVGDPIKCEVGVQNVAGTDLKGVRVEFSNGNSPWISLAAQGRHDNPDLAVSVLRDRLDLPVGSSVTVPMDVAGTATLLRSKQAREKGRGVEGSPSPAPPSEVDAYTISLWNAEHTILYDMQFTLPVIVRTTDTSAAKPYSSNYSQRPQSLD